MGWTLFFLMVVLKIPVVALLYLVWWAIRNEPDPEPGRDGGIGRPEDPKPRPRTGPSRPRGPHHEPQPPSPPRTRPPQPRVVRPTPRDRAS